MRRKLANLRDASVVARAEELLGKYRPSSEETVQLIDQWKGRLSAERLEGADKVLGRRVFERTCQQCHALFEEGGTLGPELTGSNRRDLDYLLTNMLDPNQVIGRDYQTTTAWLFDGGVVSGIERNRTKTAVTLQTENDTLVIAFDEADEIALSSLSTMPEGLLDPLTEPEVADLVAYLQSDDQAARLAQAEEASLFFDGATLSGWSGDENLWSVQEGMIVGRTEEGISENAFLLSELELADFRLSLEIHLVNDAGNSGIQFRSRAFGENSVAGYQADAGAGWWGKLYEEHGRGVLAESNAGDALKEGEWNHYVIEAKGQHVRTWLNGVLSVDLEDTYGARSGRIALQVHSGGPTEVRVRALELTLLE